MAPRRARASRLHLRCNRTGRHCRRRLLLPLNKSPPLDQAKQDAEFPLFREKENQGNQKQPACQFISDGFTKDVQQDFVLLLRLEGGQVRADARAGLLGLLVGGGDPFFPILLLLHPVIEARALARAAEDKVFSGRRAWGRFLAGFRLQRLNNGF